MPVSSKGSKKKSKEEELEEGAAVKHAEGHKKASKEKSDFYSKLSKETARRNRFAVGIYS
jgi:hypothetical protein